MDEARIDIVAQGFDAGIGPQDRAAADMIAVRVMGPMKAAVVGAPEYFARHSPPRTPEDLARHSCVQYRVVTDGGMFKWPFERSGKSQRISVDGRIMVNDPDLAVRAAVDGLGIAYTVEALAEPFLRSGQLVQVLGNWLPSFEGLFLYYPGHRQVPAAPSVLLTLPDDAPGGSVAAAAVPAANRHGHGRGPMGFLHENEMALRRPGRRADDRLCRCAASSSIRCRPRPGVAERPAHRICAGGRFLRLLRQV